MTVSLFFHLLSLLALAALAVPCWCQLSPNISFTLQSLNAPWSIRRWAAVKVYQRPLTFGATTFPANSLVLFGGGANEWYNGPPSAPTATHTPSRAGAHPLLQLLLTFSASPVSLGLVQMCGGPRTRGPLGRWCRA